MARLAGKTALVTGSASGIGFEVARRLSEAGASVVVNSASSVEAGQAAAAELRNAAYVQADVSDEAQAGMLVDAAVHRFGGLDYLVNNAGRTRVIPHDDLDAVTTDVWREILDTNVIGTWNVTRAAAPALRRAEGGGSIVNVSSLAGTRVGGSSVPYAVSKAAVDHLTRLLAKALGPQIRVNAVAPGLVDTPWTADWDDIRAMVEQTAPLRRSATPADVADMALPLLQSTYVTGEVVRIDGGLGL